MAKDSSETQKELESVPNVSLLAIDDNPEILEFIKKTCNQYSYEVTACSESLLAADVLRKGKIHINLILVEVHMPMMDGYKFLQLVNEEKINVPVIVMSSDDDKDSVLKAFNLGACDYWGKPLKEYQLKNMWTHIVRKSMCENKTQKDIHNLKNDSDEVVERSNSSSRKTNDDESKINYPPSTKKRVVWSGKLHGLFLKAIDQIGLANAVPKRILEVMNYPGLERGHVASHLQKYRKYLKTESDGVTKRQKQQQNEMSFVSRNTEPMKGEHGRIPLQPLPTIILPDLHPGLPRKMVPKREEQYDPNIQVATNFQAQQALAQDHSLTTFSNAVIPQNFSQSMETLDDAFRLCSPSDRVLVENQAINQRDNMQQSMMYHHPIPPLPPVPLLHPLPPINFHSSLARPVTQNYNFGMNRNLPQPSRNSFGAVQIQGRNNTDAVMLNQYNTRGSVYPQIQNASLPSGAVRSYAASAFDTQVPYGSASDSNQNFCLNIDETIKDN